MSEFERSEEGRDRTALVTGASSGIGRAMAELLAARGYSVVAVARRADRLEALAGELGGRYGIQVTPMVADLADPAGAEQVAERIAAAEPDVDFLVNNAGNSRIGRYETQPWGTHAERLQLMGASPMRLTYAALPGMVERGWGRIVNVASVSALFTGFPNDVTYGAVKAMLERFSEGIHAEYESLGINCTVALPGPTKTEVFLTPGSADDVTAGGIAAKIVMKPETVAGLIYDAVMRGKPWLVPGRRYVGMSVALRYSPAPVRRRLSRALCARMENG